MPRRCASARDWKAFWPTRNTSRTSHSMPVRACRNQPWLPFGPAISTTLRWLQSVSAKSPNSWTLLVDPVEDGAFPAARLAVAGDALDGVPAAAVGLPRHGGVAADRLQRHVAFLDLRGGVAGRSAAAPRAAPRPAPGRGRRRCATPGVWPRPVSGVPAATTSPPPGPASGPRSITQSAVLMTSRLCSTTMTVLPRSTSRLSTSSSL